ncbi:MAG: Rpn family recombination-promoting nuclease/putative transposase [Saprospiraceae bacterium]
MLSRRSQSWECYQYQYRNGDKLLHLVLPIVVYHGDEEWKVRDFADHFDLPHPDLKRYIPFFSYELLDLSQVSNEMLFQLEYGFMLRSSFLLYKFRRDKAMLLQFIGKIFNFANESNLPEDIVIQTLQQLLQYIYSSYKLTKSDMQKMKENIFEGVAYLPGSLWDQAVQEGKIEGEAKGKLEGIIEGEAMEKLITTLEEELELLSRMSAQDLPYDLMRKLTDVPEALLLAFREVYTPETTAHLLEQVRNARTLNDLPAIRQHLREALLAFGIVEEVAQGYLAER